MYEVQLSQRAEKQLESLETAIQQRITKALQRIRIRPHSFCKRLVGIPYFSFRVGDYRLILDIQNGNLIILVIEIAHRRSVYEHLT